MDKPTSPQEALALEAEKYLGVEEIGPDQGAQVKAFQSAVPGSKPEGQPWCMDFVQYCVRRVQLAHPWGPTLYASQSVLDVWRHTNPWARSSKPARGLVAIWQKNGSWEGHCGIVLSVDDSSDTFETIEGNTMPGKGISRTGDGVYEKVRQLDARNILAVGQLRLLGFIDAFR